MADFMNILQNINNKSNGINFTDILNGDNSTLEESSTDELVKLVKQQEKQIKEQQERIKRLEGDTARQDQNINNQTEFLNLIGNRYIPDLEINKEEKDAKKLVLSAIILNFTEKDPQSHINARKFSYIVECASKGAINHSKVKKLMLSLSINQEKKNGGIMTYPGFKFKDFVESIPEDTDTRKVGIMKKFFQENPDLEMTEEKVSALVK